MMCYRVFAIISCVLLAAELVLTHQFDFNAVLREELKRRAEHNRRLGAIPQLPLTQAERQRLIQVAGNDDLDFLDDFDVVSAFSAVAQLEYAHIFGIYPDGEGHNHSSATQISTTTPTKSTTLQRIIGPVHPKNRTHSVDAVTVPTTANTQEHRQPSNQTTAEISNATTAVMAQNGNNTATAISQETNLETSNVETTTEKTKTSSTSCAMWKVVKRSSCCQGKRLVYRTCVKNDDSCDEDCDGEKEMRETCTCGGNFQCLSSWCVL